jgi:E3 ubiquitin-protein ligase EDD1
VNFISQAQLEQSMDTMDENQEVSANVTIETTNMPLSAQQLVQELPPRGVYFRTNITSDLLLGRWRLSLILFGRVFQEDVGMEPGSIISELGGFPVKEAKFRRHMEKLRNGQQRDLTLSKIDRARSCLIPQTFKELNTQYNNHNRRISPPLAFNRVKVTFKDEPGEGSGVARSFYTLIAEALLSRENLPNLESAQVGSNKYNVPFSTMIRQRNTSGGTQSSPSVTIASNLASNIQSRDLSEPLRRLPSKRTLWRNRESNRKVPLNYEARPFRPASEGGINEHLSNHQQQLGERIYNKVFTIHPSHAAKITGMLLDLPPTQWIMLVSSDETLRQRSNEAMAVITFRTRLDRDTSGAGGGNNNNPQLPASVSLNISSSATLNIISTEPTSQDTTSQPQQGSSSVSQQSSSKKLNPIVVLSDCQIDDNAPLFYQPGKPNFYSPRQGYPSFERINAFRNVGR